MTIRVVVVEDSPTVRALLVAIFESDPEFLVVGEAGDGAQAVPLARDLRPDVITIDIHMPGMNGLEATRQIMHLCPTPIVVISDSVGLDEVTTSMEALRAGALTALAKPVGPEHRGFDEQCRQLRSTVKAMSEVKVVRRWRASATPPLPPPARAGTDASLVTIAASTGGPAALHRVFSDLPASLPVPILVVQHIAHGFLAGLVEWWNTVSPLRIKIAEQGDPLSPGKIFVAPDDKHLGLRDRRTLLVSDAPPLEGHRPSATFLFDSAAQVYGRETLSLILTGMGRDGVDGLVAVRAAGGHVIAQDEDTCVVFGMPGMAAKAGVVNEILPLGRIGSHLAGMFAGRAAMGAIR